MNIQQILNEVKASNDRLMRNSAEAMASVQGVATVLSIVTDQIDTLEATLTQTNRNTQKIALKLEQHSTTIFSNTTVTKLINSNMVKVSDSPHTLAETTTSFLHNHQSIWTQPWEINRIIK